MSGLRVVEIRAVGGPGFEGSDPGFRRQTPSKVVTPAHLQPLPGHRAANAGWPNKPDELASS